MHVHFCKKEVIIEKQCKERNWFFMKYKHFLYKNLQQNISAFLNYIIYSLSL